MSSLDRNNVTLAGRSGDAVLDAWILAGGRGLVDCVWMQGGKVVENGRHRNAEAIAQRFRRTLERLLTA